jgi:MFS family permease
LRAAAALSTLLDVTDSPGSRSIRGLVGVLSAYAASLSANRLLSIAVPWFVYSTTGSLTKTGVVAFSQMAPFVVSQLLSGPLIDRIGPKAISVAGDTTSMVAMATAPLLYAADALPLWALMALMAVVGAADGPATAAKSVFVPSVTKAAGAPIERGTGLTTTVERTASTLGPLAAGLLISAFGGPMGLWLACALFGVAALVVALTLTNPVADPREAGASTAEGYVAQLREGATFLRKDGLLRAIVGMTMATNLLDQAFIAVLLPAWAIALGVGADAVGLLVSVFAATSIMAALVTTTLAGRLPRRTVYLVGFVVGGLPRFVAMALMWPMWAVVTVFAIGGLGSGFINPIVGAVSYERIPAPLLGRVRTLASSLSWAGIPFGGLFAAGVAGLLGLSGALWVTGALYLVAIVVPGLRKGWSEMAGPSGRSIRAEPAEAGRS